MTSGAGVTSSDAAVKTAPVSGNAPTNNAAPTTEPTSGNTPTNNAGN